MPDFTHVIVTRFNLPLWGGQGPDDVWMADRFELFETYCVPTLRAQTQQNFKWVVLFSSKTTERFRERINRVAGWPNFEPVFLDKFYSKRTIDAVTACIQPQSSHLITTTLDNDDGLSADFVASVQAMFCGQSFEIVNFTNGLRLNTGTQKLYHCSVACSPFVSLIESLDVAPHTIVRCLPHSTIVERYESVIEVESPPRWLQIVHGRNAAATTVRGWQRASRGELARFGLSAETLVVADEKRSMRRDNLVAKVERQLIDATPMAVKHQIRKALWRRRND